MIAKIFYHISVGWKIHHCNNFYWVAFFHLTLFFQAQFGLISCIIVLKEFFSMFKRETGKRHFLLFLVMVAKKEKSFFNNKNLVDSNYHWKNWVDWMSNKWEKKLQPQKTSILWKRGQKLKKHVHLNFMTTFHCRGSWNLALMTLGDTSTHNSYFVRKPHPETNYIIILHGPMKSVILLHFSCTKFNHIKITQFPYDDEHEIQHFD